MKPLFRRLTNPEGTQAEKSTGRGLVRNTIDPDLTGYIKKERLETRLRQIFGMTIEVQHFNDRFAFDAPRKVAQNEISDLQETDRVN